VSEFTKDVLFRDIELVPMVENYDGSLEEPKHFLPLVPIALLNPTQGIAIGFATNILPRSLSDIIDIQIKFLKGRKRIKDILWPVFNPINATADEMEETDNGNVAYTFQGTVTKNNANSVVVQALPYGLSHEKFIDHLDALKEKDVIVDYEDRSKDRYEIEVKFKRGKKEDDGKAQLKLISREVENLTLIDLDSESVLTVDPIEAVRLFTKWRLSWYLRRYQRLHDDLTVQIQKYKDILTAIQKNVGNAARNANSRADLIIHLKRIKIVHTDYIAGFPVYLFTKEEKKKVEAKLAEAETVLKRYKQLIRRKDERKKVYINELRAVLKRYNKGEYLKP